MKKIRVYSRMSLIFFIAFMLCAHVVFASQCADSLDNDMDGKIDYPDDYGCINADDTEEFNAPFPAAPINGLVAGGLLWYPVHVIGPNLLANPGFESGIAPWTMGSSFTLDNTIYKTGSNSLKMVNGQSSYHAKQKLDITKGIYRIGGWAKLQGLEGSGVRFGLAPSVWGQPGGGGTTKLIKGDSDWQYLSAKSLVVTNDMNAAFSIYPYSNPPGTAWFDDLELREEIAFPIEVFMLYPNFRGYLFDDQSQTLKFDVTVNPPAGSSFGDWQVEISIVDEGSGSQVASQIFPASVNFIATMDGLSLSNGKTYLARFKLIKAGQAMYEYPAYRVSKVSGASRSSMVISFNEDNQILFRGQPKFLLGVYDSGLGYFSSESAWEDKLFSDTGSRRMDGLPINFYLNYWYNSSPSPSLGLMMNVLQQHGIMYIQSANCSGGGYNKTIYNKVLTDDAYLSALSSHPDLAGFYTMDECIPELALPVSNDAQRLKAFKPDGITFGASNKVNSLFFWRDTVDLMSMDPYPLYGAEPAGGYNLSSGTQGVADWTKAVRLALKNSRPVATVIQFFKFTAAGRWPTKDELRNMSYMAIAEGANGLWYWSIGVNALAYICNGSDPYHSPSGSGSWCPAKVDNFNNLKAVITELNNLQPALSSLDRPDLLVSNSNPSIHTRVKFANGKGYLIAYNYTNTDQAATFTWAQTPTSVSVYNEARTLPVSSNSFTDTFGPYQAHVYEMTIEPLLPDTTPPSIPTNLFAQAISSSQIDLSWSPSTDNVAVTGYKIYRDGNQVGTSASASYSDIGLVTSTTYSYAVSAYDAAGNESARSAPVTATTKPSPIAVLITSYQVSNKTANSAAIAWTTNIPSTGFVSYGTSSTNLNLSATGGALGATHSVILTNLTKSTKYYYKITATSEDSSSTASSPVSNFRTKPR